MNKYYTPDISEFYVGFEYEVDNTWGGYIKVTFKDFSPIAIGSGNDRVPFNYKARVKYLDKDDIISLGFKEENNLYLLQTFYKEDYTIYFGDNINQYQTNIMKSNKNIFRGVKSELRKLLIQLGIL